MAKSQNILRLKVYKRHIKLLTVLTTAFNGKKALKVLILILAVALINF